MAKRGEDTNNLEQERPKRKYEAKDRCTATTKHGENAGKRCRRPAIPGGTVCIKHGGKAKQVREKAQRRLEEAADGLMVELLRIAHNRKYPVYVRLQAIRDALDRAGLGAKHAKPVTVEADDPWAALVMGSLGEDRSGFGEIEPSGPEPFALGKLAEDESARAWADINLEDEAERESGRIRGDGHRVVDGEVVTTPTQGRQRAEQRRKNARNPTRHSPIPEPAQPPPESEFDNSTPGEGVPTREEWLLEQVEEEARQHRRRGAR